MLIKWQTALVLVALTFLQPVIHQGGLQGLLRQISTPVRDTLRVHLAATEQDKPSALVNLQNYFC